jgi:hypothetical protein
MIMFVLYDRITDGFAVRGATENVCMADTRSIPQDWTSGEAPYASGHLKAKNHARLLDVIAPTPKLATQVLASFSKLVKSGELNVHPVAAKQVDAGMLRKLAGEGGEKGPRAG